MQDFERAIEPFYWVQGDENFFVCLDAGDGYKAEVFNTREDEGCEGNGYDWTSIARVFLDERMPQLAEAIHFDPEAETFCVYATEEEPLRAFVVGFKHACDEEGCLADLLSRAELD